MGRLKKLFEKKNSKILNVYCTAGYPQLDSTLKVMEALQEGGVDIIELGMPFSDPLADGPVIQKSGLKALENGMSLEVLIGQLRGFRTGIEIPVILMGYLNTVLQYGVEDFVSSIAQCGVDGVILPDLPPEIFESQYKQIFEQYGIDFIFLVTPETPDERVRYLDRLSSGFLYAVSSSSTTGSDKDFSKVGIYLERLQALNLKNPVLSGFGIHDRNTFSQVCHYANGGIIGSAFVKSLEGSADIRKSTIDFIRSILKEVK